MVALAAVAFAGCSSPKAVVTKKTAESHPFYTGTLDASLDGLIYNERTDLHYHIEYDDRNLYLTLATSNQDIQRKIGYFGFTVWVDRDGSRNENQGFRYPLSAWLPSVAGEDRINASRMGLKGGSISALLEKSDEIELIGIYGSSSRTVKKRDSRIRVKAEIIDGILVYESVIPFEVLKHGFGNPDKKTVMSLGLETGYFRPPPPGRGQQSQDARRPTGGMRQPAGASGQMPGRVPDRGLMNRGFENMETLSRPTRLWLELEFKD